MGVMQQLLDHFAAIELEIQSKAEEDLHISEEEETGRVEAEAIQEAQRKGEEEVRQIKQYRDEHRENSSYPSVMQQLLDNFAAIESENQCKAREEVHVLKEEEAR